MAVPTLPAIDAVPAVAVPLADAFRAELLRAAFGPEVPGEDVHRTIAAFAGAASPNTLRALRSDLRHIDAFQRARGLPALPLTPAACFLLIDERARAGSAKASIDRLVASAVRLHQLAGLPSPVDDTVRWKLKEIRKADTRPRRQALGLRIKGEVADVHADQPLPLSLLALLESIPADRSGLRDRALLSCAYDAGLRRSEVVRARVEDFEALPSGEASLFLPRSKTDQEGEGARVWLSARTMQHVAAWQDAARLIAGYLFRPLSYRVSPAGHLSEGAVAKILKQRLAEHLAPLVERGELKASDAEAIVRDVSAHSLRVGCDQDLFAAGVDIGAIMQGLRWTSPRQPLAYARHLAPASSKLAAVMRSIR
jgi:integrase